MAALSGGCKEKAPVEQRLASFLAQATDALKANAADPDKAAAAINSLAQANAELMEELRNFKRDASGGDQATRLPAAAQEQLQKAVAELMAAAMNQKLMASPKFQEAMKAIFQ